MLYFRAAVGFSVGGVGGWISGHPVPLQFPSPLCVPISVFSTPVFFFVSHRRLVRDAWRQRGTVSAKGVARELSTPRFSVGGLLVLGSRRSTVCGVRLSTAHIFQTLKLIVIGCPRSSGIGGGGS